MMEVVTEKQVEVDCVEMYGELVKPCDNRDLCMGTHG